MAVVHSRRRSAQSKQPTKHAVDSRPVGPSSSPLTGRSPENGVAVVAAIRLKHSELFVVTASPDEPRRIHVLPVNTVRHARVGQHDGYIGGEQRSVRGSPQLQRGCVVSRNSIRKSERSLGSS